MELAERAKKGVIVMNTEAVQSSVMALNSNRVLNTGKPATVSASRKSAADEDAVGLVISDKGDKADKVASENISGAQSSIKNADMAQEAMNFIKANILESDDFMSAQANQVPQNVLRLLEAID